MDDLYAHSLQDYCSDTRLVEKFSSLFRKGLYKVNRVKNSELSVIDIEDFLSSTG